MVDPDQLSFFDTSDCKAVLTEMGPMRDLQKYFDKCRMMLMDIGIPVGKVSELKTSAKLNRWGECRRLDNGSYSISINRCLLDPRNSEDGLICTLLHEMLHTYPGCMNHGLEWQIRAAYVNQHYGYNIKAQTDSKEKGVVARPTRENRAKYIVMCSQCGASVYRLRASRLTEHPEKYRCKKCSGSVIVKMLSRSEMDVDEDAYACC